MAAPLTPQQARAVEHRGTSVVLASGAGCGKTHVLTARYLSHLRLDGVGVGEVVAITFTERAAREMRGRIRAAVAAELARTPPGTDAHARWRRHLRDLETAPVTTIHAFAAGLVRQHAAAAGIDPGFEVLDDTLAANLRTDSLRAALHRLLTDDGPAGDDLRELVVLFGWAAVQEAVDAFLLDPDPPAWDAWLARPADDIARAWLAARREALPGWVEYLSTAAPKVAHCLGVLRRAAPPSPDGKATAAFLLDGVARLPDANDLAAAVGELVERAKVGRTGKQVWGEADYPAVQKAFEDFRRDLPEKLAVFTADPGKIEEAAEVGRRVVRVAAAAYAAYRDRKRRAAAADFHDLLTLARDLLRDHPTVRAALRERFRFLLLDELQDTDPVQMELVEHLCGAGLHHGQLFAVGDVKQSIYRFRGAEVGLFRGLRAGVPAAGRMDLTRNFRSQPGVIGFVNALCRSWFPDEAPLDTHRPAVTDGGNVEFLWSVPQRGARNAERGTDGGEAADRVSRAAVLGAEADAVARRVVELLDDPTPRVADRDGAPRRVRAEDVVLLFRSMGHVATYEAALRRHGLDYYLVGGRAFFAQQEVYDLLNLLRAVENPQDGLSLAGALRSPFCNLSDEALHLIGTHKEGVWAGLFDDERFATLPADQQPAVARARRFLAGWRAAKDRLPIAGLLNRVFGDSGYDAATQFEFLGDRKLANLWKLTDLAREFDRTGFGLPEFTARLSDLVARQPREEQAATQPENADVVKLMSVHQAKGLEFPVVIVPDLGAPARGDRHPVARWHRRLGCLARLPADVLEAEREAGDVPFSELPDRLGRVLDQLADWQEDLRVLYVACTRARDLLILSAGLPEPFPPGSPTRPPAKAASHWLTALADRFDLRTGECLEPGEPARARVRLVEPGAPGTAGPPPASDSEQKPVDWSSFRIPHSAFRIPAVVSLPALERFARGEAVASVADGHAVGREWATVREQLDLLPPEEAAFRAALRRWDPRDPDGWQAPLTDHLAELPDPAPADRLADAVRPLFERFAASPLRAALAAAGACRWDVEFLLDLRAVAGTTDALLDPARDPLPVVRGLIDVLYRDAAGWHVVGIHLREVSGRDPWADRRPGLAAAAWAVRAALGETPRTIRLLDLVAGEVVEESARKLKYPACFAALAKALRAWERAAADARGAGRTAL